MLSKKLKDIQHIFYALTSRYEPLDEGKLAELSFLEPLYTFVLQEIDKRQGELSGYWLSQCELSLRKTIESLKSLKENKEQDQTS